MAVAVGTRIDLPVLCPFRLCTGHACPGCGITRATGALLRGDVASSVRFHPFAIVLAIQLVVVFAISARRAEPVSAAIGKLVRDNQWLVWLNMTALLGTWLIRWRFGLLDSVLA